MNHKNKPDAKKRKMPPQQLLPRERLTPQRVRAYMWRFTWRFTNQGPEGLWAVTDPMQLETRQSRQLSVAPPSKELQSQSWTGACKRQRRNAARMGGPPSPRERCAGATQRSFLLLRWIHLKMSTRTPHTEVEYGQRCYIQTAKNTVRFIH